MHVTEVSENSSHQPDQFFPKTLNTLELLDNIAHVFVAAFFILMAASVLVYSLAIFARQLPLINAAFHSNGQEHGLGPPGAADPFFHHSLELLSSILFVVIVLELLKTIITYLQTRDIYAIMKEFLVVGIISSVRKILLVGAESSLSGEKGMEFIKEASGTVISIIGIVLLIYGLVLLQRTHTTLAAPIIPEDTA